MSRFSSARAVLFDLDGTLVDSRPGIVAGLGHALRLLGHDLPPEQPLDWAIGPPLAEVMARLLALFGDTRVTEAVNHYRAWYGAVGLFDARVYPGIAEMLERLTDSGKALFVATSKRVDFARTVLDHFELARFFRAAHGPDLDGRHAHKADLVRHLLDTEGLSAADTLLVGDREQDVAAARANGLRVVGAAWGYGGREEVARADHVCDSPADLASLLGGTMP
jgi:phosphoglycolate phosphatase